MNRLTHIFTVLAAAVAIFAFPSAAHAQETAEEEGTIVVAPLFEYPVAPDSIADFTDKNDWLVAHFWDSFAVPQGTVGQIQLNHAFDVFTVPMLYARADIATAAVDKLIGRLKGNSALMLQFTRAAEDCLYGPRARAWVDGIFLRFAKALVAEKKVNDQRKAKYKTIISQLENSMIGAKFPQLKTSLANGKSGKLQLPKGKTSLVFIGRPDDADFIMAKVKLDTDSRLAEKLSAGDASVVVVLASAEAGSTKFPEGWSVVSSPEAANALDTRNNPAIYIINPDGTIRFKTADPARGVDALVEPHI